MSSYHQLNYHVIFATKYRKQWIARGQRERLYQYVGGIVRSIEGHLIEIGGIEDHVHLLLNIPPTIAVSDAVRTIKANSSKWIHETRVFDVAFSWQKGYGAFTVSYSQCPVVRRYIQNQELHHVRRSFKEEYVLFLQKHGLTYDPRYLFEQEFHG